MLNININSYYINKCILEGNKYDIEKVNTLN